MSVLRLVIGIVFLALGSLFFRGRRRLADGGDRSLRTGGRAVLFVTVLAWIYTLVGLLWVALAFA